MGEFCLTLISSLFREPIFCFTTSGFKMATGCRKWLPAVLGTDSSHYRHQKMAAVWRIFVGRAGISPIGTHWTVFNAFQWFFYFTWHFHSTAISLERINVVKRGTTVTACQSFPPWFSTDLLTPTSFFILQLHFFIYRKRLHPKPAFLLSVPMIPGD